MVVAADVTIGSLVISVFSSSSISSSSVCNFAYEDGG